MFAKTRFRYIEVLFHTFHCERGRKYRSLYRGLRIYIRFTLSGAENIVRYIEDFVYRGSLYRGSRILICVYLQNWCGHYSERAISFATKFEDHSPKPWRYTILTKKFFLACLNVASKYSTAASPRTSLAPKTPY